MIKTEPCTETELELLREEKRTSSKALIWGIVLVVIIAAVVPWLGSSKTHGKAMVDQMGFAAAFVSIFLVGSFIMGFYYLITFPKINKDLNERIKTIEPKKVIKKRDTVTERVSKYKFKEVKGTFIDLEGPQKFKYFKVTPEEFHRLNEGDTVDVEYFANTKKIIRIKKL